MVRCERAAVFAFVGILGWEARGYRDCQQAFRFDIVGASPLSKSWVKKVCSREAFGDVFDNSAVGFDEDQGAGLVLVGLGILVFFEPFI